MYKSKFTAFLIILPQLHKKGTLNLGCLIALVCIDLSALLFALLVC